MQSISVVIPSYNSTATIDRCIRSVLATGWPNLEVVVVDDCSTDRSPAMVEALAAEFPGQVRLVRQEVNGGPAKARNAGARVAKGELLFFLDSDTEMRPDALAKFVARMSSDKAEAVVGVYGADPLNAGAVPLYKALLNNYFFIRKGVIDYEVFDSSRAGITAEAFRQLGGFNEGLGWGMDYENEELGYRIHGRHRMVLDPEVEVRHMFPGLGKLTRVYFLRVALWMEVFATRRKFESGGVTSAETGLSSACLLLAIGLLPLALLPLPAGWVLWPALAAFLVYLYGYAGFFAFVARQRPTFLPGALALNVFFTLVIAAGAAFGLIRVISGKSDVAAIGGDMEGSSS